MAGNAKQAFATALKLALALGLLLWLVSKGVLDLDSLGRIWSWELAFGSLIFVGAALAINNTRWWILLKSQGFERSWSSVFSLTLIGNFFNFALPGGVGGDVVKGYYLVRDQGRDRMKAALSILMDRALGFYTMFLLALLALLVSPEARAQLPQVFQLVLLGWLGLSAALWVALYQSMWLSRFLSRQPWGPKAERLQQLLAHLREWGGASKALFLSLVLSVGSQGLQVMVVWLTGLAYGAEISLATYFFLVPLATVFTVLPLSPAGVGVGQAAAYYLFRAYNPAYESVGPLGFTVIHVSLLAWGLVGALIYVKRKDVKIGEVKSD